jgi:hypothetical protein
MTKMFYLQDSRSYVGNDMQFWAIGGGYTTNVSQANTYTLAEAQDQHNSRETDIPWPKEYIDGKTRPAVDVQYCRRDEALEGTGIVLQEKDRKPVRKILSRCQYCGSFMNEVHVHIRGCPKCGGDNRP